MKIVHVLDLYDESTNGVSTSTKRNVEILKKKGHEVIVLATGGEDKGKISVEEFKIPIFQSLVDKQGFKFAKKQDEKYYEAFKGADIIHFQLATPFCIRGKKIADEMNIPSIVSFHVQPQNITYTLGLGKSEYINKKIYEKLYEKMYKKFEYIHAPSEMIKNELIKNGYKNKIRVISNGVNDAFKKLSVNKEEKFKNKFVILKVGRLSKEKRQDLVIKAVYESKYKDKIQLVFAGRGPEKENLEKLGKNLKNKPIFNFYSEEELIKLMNMSDLYIHASDAEIEGIAALEAISCGLVPVISSSKLSATNSFAITDKSIFEAGDKKDLASKIDYWIENDDERKKYSDKYLKSIEKKRISNTIEEMEKLYKDVIESHKKNRYLKKDQEVSDFKYLKKGIEKKDSKKAKEKNYIARFVKYMRLQMYKIFSFFAHFVLFILYGIKVEGRENFEKIQEEGGISIMNHIHDMDSTMAGVALSLKKVAFVSTYRNFRSPVINLIFKVFNVIPTPNKNLTPTEFVNIVNYNLDKNNIVHFFPEGMIIKNYDGLREFKNGAFHFSIRKDKAILPMAIKRVFPEKKYIIRKNKPRYLITIGNPIYPNKNLEGKKALDDLKNRAFDEVKYLLNKEPAKKMNFRIFITARFLVFIGILKHFLKII